LLNELFPNRWLGRGWPVFWPPRSPDLKTLDYYFWGYMHTFVYETEVDSRAALRRRIFAAAEQINNHHHNIASATVFLKIRAKKCIAAGGGHFEAVL